jgi:hypothetical protein
LILKVCWLGLLVQLKKWTQEEWVLIHYLPEYHCSWGVANNVLTKETWRIVSNLSRSTTIRREAPSVCENKHKLTTNQKAELKYPLKCLWSSQNWQCRSYTVFSPMNYWQGEKHNHKELQPSLIKMVKSNNIRWSTDGAFNWEKDELFLCKHFWAIITFMGNKSIKNITFVTFNFLNLYLWECNTIIPLSVQEFH